MMSVYLNNAARVLDFTVRKEPIEECHADLKHVAKTIVGGIWNDLEEDHDNDNGSSSTGSCVVITPMSGGITNSLFKLSLENVQEKDQDSDARHIIVRLYGEKTEVLIDREKDNSLMAHLSELRFGPTYYGRFCNGRIEGYFDAGPLEPAQMADPSITPLIAKELCRMHRLLQSDLLIDDQEHSGKKKSKRTEREQDTQGCRGGDRGGDDDGAGGGKGVDGGDGSYGGGGGEEGAEAEENGQRSNGCNSSSTNSTVTSTTSTSSSITGDVEVKVNHDARCFTVLQDWLKLAQAVSFTDDVDKAKALTELELDKLLPELEWLRTQLLEEDGDDNGDDGDVTKDDTTNNGCVGVMKASLLSASTSVKGFCAEIVFGHQDLLALNILYRKGWDRVRLIDFEYGGYNHRAFDIANHFCEHAGFDCDYVGSFPTKAAQLRFIEAYVRELLDSKTETEEGGGGGGGGGEEEDVATSAGFLEEMREMVCKWVLASHMFWGVWAVIQAKYSTNDFDYLNYSKLRLEAYNTHKDAFFGPTA